LIIVGIIGSDKIRITTYQSNLNLAFNSPHTFTQYKISTQFKPHQRQSNSKICPSCHFKRASYN